MGEQTAVDPDWWRGAVIYQIYPRSFQDSNDDGIGDLAGITRRLDYIASLGVDAIWISPFFRSPMKDFGYDVEDYRDVDPMFGTLDDFRRLLDCAHDLGLRVMIDLVLSHTSDQHPWFRESVASRDNAKSDWYVWADARADGTPPNNWLSIFGGSAWQWSTRRCQYYMHNFLTSQPDLNFHNPEVQQALLDVARYWLDMGVDGFRLDTINFYVHDAELRDNPALSPEERNSSIAPAVNPYNYQNHLHDKNRPENLNFLERFRRLLDEYPAATAVGEVGDAQYGMQILKDYTAGNERVHMCYTFEMLSPDLPTASHIDAVLGKFAAEAPDSWICWAFSNHDVVRHPSRWQALAGSDERAAVLHASLLLALRGSVCLYQGEELGLPEADVPFDRLQDPYGIEFWPEFKGRDGCRTPMVWQGEHRHGGFSEVEPWLPVDHHHLTKAVDQQNGRNDSVLAKYRELLATRRRHPALVRGSLGKVSVNGKVLSFERELDGERILCLYNLGTDVAQGPRMAEPGQGGTEVIWSSAPVKRESDGHLQLGPFESHWVRLGQALANE